MLTMKQARAGVDMSQEEAAKALGVHVTTYRAYEQRPEIMRIEHARAFCKATGTKFEDIFFNLVSS